MEQSQEKVEEFNKLLEELPEGIPIVYLDESAIKKELQENMVMQNEGKKSLGKFQGKEPRN